MNSREWVIYPLNVVSIIFLVAVNLNTTYQVRVEANCQLVGFFTIIVSLIVVLNHLTVVKPVLFPSNNKTDLLQGFP